jgi:DNA-binding GntR family transcriptional regulator
MRWASAWGWDTMVFAMRRQAAQVAADRRAGRQDKAAAGGGSPAQIRPSTKARADGDATVPLAPIVHATQDKALVKVVRRAATLADEAYRQLADALVAGALRPGDRLIMDRLAEQLDISRTPVRDALRRLEKDGLVAAAGRRGYIVRSLGAGEVVRLFQAREAVEGYAAHLVAEAGPDAVKRVELAIQEAAATSPRTPEASYHANRLIHRAIVEASGNHFLVELFDALWTQTLALCVYDQYFRHEAHPEQQVDRDHRPLVAALRSGDGDAAARALIRHVRDGLRITEGRSAAQRP